MLYNLISVSKFRITNTKKTVNINTMS